MKVFSVKLLLVSLLLVGFLLEAEGLLSHYQAPWLRKKRKILAQRRREQQRGRRSVIEVQVPSPLMGKRDGRDGSTVPSEVWQARFASYLAPGFGMHVPIGAPLG